MLRICHGRFKQTRFLRLLSPLKAATLCLMLGQVLPVSTQAQEEKKPAGAVQITFLPPPLEHATYSLGVFDARNDNLVRHLQEFAAEKSFTVGLNGLITIWDGKDDAGKPVPPGRYDARGFAVGAIKIEGADILGNDWAADDESLRFRQVTAIVFVPADGGVAVLATLPDGSGEIARFSGQGDLLWRKPVAGYEPRLRPWLSLQKQGIAFMPRLGREDTNDVVVSTANYHLEDGSKDEEHDSAGLTFHVGTPALPAVTADDVSVDALPAGGPPVDAQEAAALLSKVPSEMRSPGKDHTTWIAAGAAGLVQVDRGNNVLRRLDTAPGDPLPRQVSASSTEDRLYLLETRPGWTRVRGLAWSDTKEENGKAISTWQTFFERSIRPPAARAATAEATAPVEINLDENPLSPGKPQKIRLVATFDAKGSYLSTEGGLRLRRVSEHPFLQSVYLAKGKPPSPLDFFQYDGAATDEFSITGVHRIMAFDAGEFEMTATGEKPAETRTAEPPDL